MVEWRGVHSGQNLKGALVGNHGNPVWEGGGCCYTEGLKGRPFIIYT